MFISELSLRFSLYRLACVYTEGGVEDVGLAAGLVSPTNCVITTEVLCNNNRRKYLLTELFLSDVIILNPFIESASLLDMVLRSFWLGNSL